VLPPLFTVRLAKLVTEYTVPVPVNITVPPLGREGRHVPVTATFSTAVLGALTAPTASLWCPYPTTVRLLPPVIARRSTSRSA